MKEKPRRQTIKSETDYCDGVCQTDSSFCGMFGICRITKGFLEVPFDKDVIR